MLGARDPEEAADIAPLLADRLAALTVHDPAALRGAGLRESGERATAGSAASGSTSTSTCSTRPPCPPPTT